MASTTRTIQSDLAADKAFEVAKVCGTLIENFSENGIDEESRKVTYRRGWGMTNPQDVTFAVSASGDGSEVAVTVAILALMDPFGFTKTSADRFVFAFEEHVRCIETGETPSPPPKDNKGMMVFIGTLVLLFAFMFLLFVSVFFAIILTS